MMKNRINLLIAAALFVGFFSGYVFLYSTQVAHYNAQIDLMGQRLESFNSSLFDKEKVIGNLTEQISYLQSQLESQQEAIREKDAKISSLERFIPSEKNKISDFTVIDLDGTTFTLSDHQGEVLVLSFISSWCSSCLQEITYLKTVYEKYGDELTMLTMSVDVSDTIDRLRDIRTQYFAQWAWAVGNMNISIACGIESTPAVIIVDRNGYIWVKYEELTYAGAINTEIAQLLTYIGTSELNATFTNLSVEDSKNLIELNHKIILLDVRTEEEYNELHIEGAVNIPLQVLSNRLGELDKNSTILVYCKKGARSATACQILAENEYIDVYNMEGGIDAWVAAQLPVVSTP